MNMVSELRRRVNTYGLATLTPEEYNQLQVEWITRVVPEGYVLVPKEPSDAVAQHKALVAEVLKDLE